MAGDPSARPPSFLYLFLFSLLYLESSSLAYRPGDIVPMSKAGQYHGSRTVWHDVIGRHCPIFAVNREVLIPLEKPSGYTGADAYKIDILALTWDNQFADHFRGSVEMICMVLLLKLWICLTIILRFIKTFGSTSGIQNVGQSTYLSDTHETGLVLSFILAIYVLQSSWDKLARCVRETVAESSVPGGVAKVE